MRLVPGFIREVAHPLKLAITGMNTLPGAIKALERKALASQGFNDKVLYRMAFDRREILEIFSDKVASHEYAAQLISPEYMPKRYGIYEQLPEQRPADWPEEFVVKASHGSGSAVIVWKGAPDSTLPTEVDQVKWSSFVINPSSLNWSDLRRLSDQWMQQNFYWWPGRFPEWAYKSVPPRIIVEELLTDSDGIPSRDLKFFMFDGACKLIHVDSERFNGHMRDVFDEDWNPLPFTIKFPQSANPMAKPNNLHEMIAIAEKLSVGMDFVRVDLYNTFKGIKFGEMTNYPAGGVQEFHPSRYDTWLGTFWNIADYTSSNGTREIH